AATEPEDGVRLPPQRAGRTRALHDRRSAPERELELLANPAIRLPREPRRERETCGLASDPPQRPRRVPTHQRLGVLERTDQRRHRLRRTPVPQRDRNVAQEPRPLRPPDRRPARKRVPRRL